MDLSSAVASLTLETELGRPAELSVRLPDPYSLLSAALQEGVELTLEWGTREAHALVFRGPIYALSATMPRDGTPTLTLTAYDALMRLGIRNRSRSWPGRSLRGLAAEVAREHGLLGADVQLEADPAYGGAGIHQREETDLALLLRLAEAQQAELMVIPKATGDTLRLVSRAALWRAGPVLTTVYGRPGAQYPVHSFDAQVWTTSAARDVRLAATLVDGSDVSVATQAPSPKGLNDPFLEEALARLSKDNPKRAAALELLIAAAPGTRAELEARLGPGDLQMLPGLQADLQEIDARRRNRGGPRTLGMEGTATAPANTPLGCGQVARVLGVGPRFTGDWLITQTRRTIEQSEFRFEFTCMR